MSVFSSYKKIFLLGFIIVILVAIPFSVYLAQKRQNISSKATASTTLSFEPSSKTVSVGDTLTLNIFLDPGKGTPPNQVSYAKLSINFDASKFTTIPKTDTEESLMPNATGNTMTTIVDDPKYESGKATMSLSIGADPTKAIVTRTKIATLQLQATAVTTPTEPNITFDTASNNTQVLSIASSDQTSENVLLSTTIPATVTVVAATATTTTSPIPTATTSTSPIPTATTTAAPIPTTTVAASPAINNPPICSSLNIDRLATGSAPYSLTFTAIGNDSDGTISKASFNFGDGPVQILTSGGGIGTNSVSSQISHTYNNAGIYTAYAILTDNSGNLSAQQTSCTKTITVNSAPIQASQPSPTTIAQQPIPQPTLPPTGDGKIMFGLGALGAILTIIGGVLLLL